MISLKIFQERHIKKLKSQGRRSFIACVQTVSYLYGYIPPLPTNYHDVQEVRSDSEVTSGRPRDLAQEHIDLTVFIWSQDLCGGHQPSPSVILLSFPSTASPGPPSLTPLAWGCMSHNLLLFSLLWWLGSDSEIPPGCVCVRVYVYVSRPALSKADTCVNHHHGECSHP